MKSKIKVCLIGFGNVGQGLYLKTVTKNSHLQAIRANKNLDLVAVVDPDIEERKVNISGVVFAKTIKELQELHVDIAIVSCATNNHLKACSQLVQYLKPKAILIEKPVGSSLAECKKIRNILTEIPVVIVNYQRNYDRSIYQQIAAIVSHGSVKGVVYYSNGALNNASHGLALLISVLGKPTNVSRLPSKKRARSSDVDLDFVVEFGETRIVFIATKESDYSMFRIELFGSKGSWLYDAGLERTEMRERTKDPLYLDRFSLTQNSTITPVPDNDSFIQVYDYLEKRLRGNSDLEINLGAGLDLAYEVHKVIENAQK